jgi:membrane fusion protein, multidrug efflux system
LRLAAAPAGDRIQEFDIVRFSPYRGPFILAHPISDFAAEPGAFVEAGTVLAEIAQLNPILVSFYVPYDERQRAFEKVGTSIAEELFKRSTLSLELPSGREYQHSGKPEYQGGQIDQSTSMMTIWAEFPNPDHILVPGLKVRVVSHLAD